MSDDKEPRLSKTCTKCGREKPIAEFYLRRKTGKRVAACRTCCRAASRQWHADQLAKDPEGYREHRHELYEREDKEKRRARFRRYYHRDKKRAAMRNRFGYLRAKGVLELAETCAECGGKAEDLHHWDEEGELRLRSLCHRCHMHGHYVEWREHGGGSIRQYWEFDEEA